MGAGVELDVLVDHSMGGSSLNDGQIELMVYRRVLEDDSRGVGEPLNETMCGCTACHCSGLAVRGTQYFVLDKTEDAHALRRALSEQLNFHPVLAFGPVTKTLTHASFSLVSKALPANV